MRRVIATMLFVLAVAGTLWWWLRLADPHVDPPAMSPEPSASATPAVANAPVAPAATPTVDASRAEDPSRAPAVDAVTEQLLRVRVVDADEQPIEGATIETFDDSTPGVVRTDREGQALLPGPIRGDSRRLLVSAGNRHRQAYWQFRPDLTIKVPWYGPLRGRVVDRATGAAIPGTVVTRPHNFCKHCEADRAVADANGAFELAALPRNEDSVFVFTADGYPRQHERMRLPGNGDAISHDFTLQRGVVVTGRCVDLATKKPLAGARILHGGEPIATAAADGSFRTLVLADNDRVALQFGCDGHCRVTFVIRTPQLDPGVEYPLPPSATVSGHVVTPTGTPIANARVNASVNGSLVRDLPGMPSNCQVEDEDYGLKALTDAAGAFTVSGLVPTGTYRVRASHADHEPPSDDRRWGTVVELEERAPQVEIVLVPKAPKSPTGTVVGTFRCNGEPRAAVLRWQQGTQQGDCTVDARGVFRSDRVLAGHVQVTVIPTPFENGDDAVFGAVAWRGDVDVVANQETRLDIVHEFAEATITGRITFADGAPAPRRAVWAFGARVRLEAESGDDGRYVLRLTPAIGKVKIGCGWGTGTDREVQPGATGIDFVVPRPGTLLVRMRHADGTFADADISPLRGSYFARLGILPARDPDGRVAIPLDEGTHSLLFTERAHVPEVRTVTVVGTTSLDVTLVRGVDVTLRLKPGTAAPPGGLVVQVIDAAFAEFPPQAAEMVWRSERSIHLIAEGETLRGLGSGTHRLVARHPAIELEPATFTVGSTPVTIDVTWRARAK